MKARYHTRQPWNEKEDVWRSIMVNVTIVERATVK